MTIETTKDGIVKAVHLWVTCDKLHLKVFVCWWKHGMDNFLSGVTPRNGILVKKTHKARFLHSQIVIQRVNSIIGEITLGQINSPKMAMFRREVTKPLPLSSSSLKILLPFPLVSSSLAFFCRARESENSNWHYSSMASINIFDQVKAISEELSLDQKKKCIYIYSPRHSGHFISKPSNL